MNFLAELETMAVNAVAAEDAVIEPEDIKRWQVLFGYTESEARQSIETYRNHLTRARISDGLWDVVATEKTAEGNDRESYEYSLSCTQKAVKQDPTIETGTFIVQLTGPLLSPQTVQDAAGLQTLPRLVSGVGDGGETQFCEINGVAKAALLSWIAKHHSSFRPTIVKLIRAKKDLCSHTLAPFLGLDSTLPQHRLNGRDSKVVPTQDQYPVWYFFYGTLMDAEVLTTQLGLEEEPTYLEALVFGGQLRTWAGKYKALVNASAYDIVIGSAFLVTSREQEDALRFYETDKYEVVRCQIETSQGQLSGLTFRFVGDARDLD